MTSDHSPVFASFEVGVASQFVSKQGTISWYRHYIANIIRYCFTANEFVCYLPPSLQRDDVILFLFQITIIISDPNSAPQGGIQIMNCVATLFTKSKTKFFIEYHSSCLESTFCFFLIGSISLNCLLQKSKSHHCKYIVFLNVHRNCKDIRGRKHRATWWVNKSLVWQPS